MDSHYCKKNCRPHLRVLFSYQLTFVNQQGGRLIIYLAIACQVSTNCIRTTNLQARLLQQGYSFMLLISAVNYLYRPIHCLYGSN